MENKCTELCDHVQCIHRRKRLLSYLQYINANLLILEKFPLDEEFEALLFLFHMKVTKKLTELMCEAVTHKWKDEDEAKIKIKKN